MSFDNAFSNSRRLCKALHTRRKFKHAKDSDPTRSEQALLLIQQLYAVERQAREQNLNHEQRYQLRQEKSVPVMDALGQWIVDEYPKVLPKSAIGKAFYYLIGRYNKIYIYLQDGRLEIDNNFIEVRPVYVGTAIVAGKSRAPLCA